MCIDTSAEPNPSFLSARQCESNKRKIRKCSWCGWVQSHWHPKQVRSKGRKANTVRREVAACLLYCGHEHDPPFCSVWHCHRVSGCCRWGNSSISLTFMGLSGGGCPFRLLLLRESPYLPAMGASCSQVIYLHSETDVTQREERVLPSLCRWRHNLEASTAFWQMAMLLPSAVFILSSCWFVRCVTYRGFFLLFPATATCCIKCVSMV